MRECPFSIRKSRQLPGQSRVGGGMNEPVSGSAPLRGSANHSLPKHQDPADMSQSTPLGSRQSGGWGPCSCCRKAPAQVDDLRVAGRGVSFECRICHPRLIEAPGHRLPQAEDFGGVVCGLCRPVLLGGHEWSTPRSQPCNPLADAVVPLISTQVRCVCMSSTTLHGVGGHDRFPGGRISRTALGGTASGVGPRRSPAAWTLFHGQCLPSL